MAPPSTRSVGTNRKTLSLGMASEEVVLPCDTTSTPRLSASSRIAAISEFDCGPMTTRAPRRATCAKPAAARAGDNPVSTTSSATRMCRCASSWFQCSMPTASAALVVAPRLEPEPVSDSSAPIRMTVVRDAAAASDASELPSRTTVVISATSRYADGAHDLEGTAPSVRAPTGPLASAEASVVSSADARDQCTHRDEAARRHLESVVALWALGAATAGDSPDHARCRRGCVVPPGSLGNA